MFQLHVTFFLIIKFVCRQDILLGPCQCTAAKQSSVCKVTMTFHGPSKIIISLKVQL